MYDTLIEKGILPSEEDKKKEEPEIDDKEEENKEEEEEENKEEEEENKEEEDNVNKEEETEQTNKEEPPSTDEKKDKTTGCNIEEILAVLCHELGHWNFSHTLKLMAMNQVFTKLYT